MTKRVLRALYAFSFLIIMILCSCQANNTPPDIVTDFSSKFTASYRGEEYSGSISANRQGVICIGIDNPKELDGIRFNYKNGELEMSRENLICSADEAYLPQRSFPSLVKAIISGVSQGRAKLVSQDENKCSYNLATDSGACVLMTGTDGKITSAEIKKAELKIKFFEIKNTIE